MKDKHQKLIKVRGNNMKTFKQFLSEQYLKESKSKIPDIITVDGKNRPTKNSKGQYIANTLDAIENFWKWFGDSKVVDSKKRPIVCYHGTYQGFEEFRPSGDGKLIFVSPDPEEAHVFGKFIMPVYVKILKLKSGVVLASDEVNVAKKSKSIDGFKVRDCASCVINYAVFHPNQIKSAVSNKGSFSLSDNKISEDLSNKDQYIGVNHFENI